MRKPSIPSAPKNPGRENFDNAVKETLEILTGRRSKRIKTLPEDASLSDVIAKVNEIISLLQE